MIGREEILMLIPHQGSMCLWDRVLSWNADEVTCETESHRDPSNPLRRDGRLAAVHLIEYGAQAMAIHGGLLAKPGSPARPGMLAAVRDFNVEIDRLDDLAGALRVLARRKIVSAGALMYEFQALQAERVLAAGRVSVILASDAAAP